jgi:hypothetical protein
MTALHEAPLVPASFNPLLAPADPLAASWLAEATLRLRRELAWAWQLGPARPADPVSDSIDRLRHAGARQQFFDEDTTARWLGEQIAAVRAQRGAPTASHPRSRWLRAVHGAGLDEAAQFVLALALAARADAGFGAVAAACQAETSRPFATLALAQRLWDEPLALLACADPAHGLYRHALLRAPAGDAWQQPLELPAALAPLLLDPAAPGPVALRLLADREGAESAEVDDALALDGAVLAWLRALPPSSLQIVPLVLPHGADARPVAHVLARAVGDPLFALAPDIGPDHAALPGLAAAAWLDGRTLLAPEAWPLEHLFAALAPLAALPLRLLLPVSDGAALRGLPPAWLAPAVPVPALALAERRRRLAATLPAALAPQAMEMARRFRFNDRTLGRVTTTISALPEPTAEAAQAVCHAAAALDMGQLAQAVRPRFSIAEVVLPARQQSQLQALCDAMRALARVHHDWGSARAWNEAGIAVLFCGPPGTGKTMVAEALAAELGLPMFRIDLSQVVNKYIGETEKNLRRIFDAAEAADCLLFFDEADALFGKRTEVKDAHDRYANIEVSYLLERMERFKGLAVLATNRRKDIDEAFARRLRFVVEFPLPGPAERERLWRTMFPPAVDLSELDFAFVAQRFELAGGPIRSAAFNACLQAASRGPTPKVAMPELLLAIKRELEKAGRLTQREQFGHYAHLVPEHA